MPKSMNLKTLIDFRDYCREHPEERFWQALRNWSGADFILRGSGPVDDMELHDTFYDE